MSVLSSGQTLRTRAKSRLSTIGTQPNSPARIGYITPDVPIHYDSQGIAGVTQWFWVAPAKCRVVAIRELHSVVGAGASKVFIRKHKAAQTAAPAAAASGTNIVDLVAGGIAADSAVNVTQAPAVVATTGDTPATAYAEMKANDKLAIVCPGTWVGMVDIYINWLA